MRLRFQLTEEEYLRAAYGYSSSRRGSRLANVISGLFLVFCAVAFVVAIVQCWRGAFPVWFVVLWGVLLSGLIIMVAKGQGRIRESFSANRALKEPLEIECDSRGIVIRGDTIAAATPYCELEWSEDEHFVYLSGFFIPKRAFATPADVEVLRGWFNQCHDKAITNWAVTEITNWRHDETAAESAAPKEDAIWQVEVQLTERDVAQGQRLLWFGTSRLSVIRFGVGGLVVFLFVCAVYINEGRWLDTAARGAVGIVPVLAIHWFSARRERKKRRATTRFPIPVVVTMYRDALHLRTFDGWRRLERSTIDKFLEDDDVIAWRERSGLQCVLSKRGFQSREQIDMLRKLMQPQTNRKKQRSN